MTLCTAFKTIIKLDNHNDPEVGDTLGIMVKGLVNTTASLTYPTNRIGL